MLVDIFNKCVVIRFNAQHSHTMLQTNDAFEDFVDDCFIDDDPICNINRERSLELAASKIISELLTEEEKEDFIAA